MKTWSAKLICSHQFIYKTHQLFFFKSTGIGEVVDGGQDNLLLQKINEKLELKSYFALWKDAVELSATKRRKAEFYDRYNCLEKSLKIWKNAVKDIQKKKEEDKWFKAAAFDGTRLLR